MNEGFGKDFYRKGNSVKRSGDSVNRRTLKTEKLLSSSPSRKSAPSFWARFWGAVGRLIAIDPWGNGTCVLIAKGSDLQDPELVHGLQPKTVAVECVRLSQPRIVPDGWNQDALLQFASRWQTIHTPDGKDLWLKMDTGQTQYTSPFVAEIKPDSSDLAEELTAYWGETTDPANAVV